MRKNEAGLTILEKGDTVRVGSGKVRYTVFHDENQYGVVDIQSHNTGRVTSEHRNRLHLVQSVQDAAYEAGSSVEELTGVAPEEKPVKVRNMDQMREDLANGNPEFTDEEIKQNTRTQQGVARARAKRKPASAYQKAVLFALNKLGKHVYAGTVRKNVKAKRRSLTARQKANRKANR